MAFDKILVVDDELVIRKSFEAQLRKRRYSVASTDSLEGAKAYLNKDQFDLVFLDMRLPDGQGTELLQFIKNAVHQPMVVMVTGHGSIESAVESMKQGAFDYVVKPCSMDQIEMIVKKAEEYAQLVKVNQYFSDELLQASQLLGESQAMRSLKALIQKVAVTSATVLVTGENGTGKEVVASELYRLSSLHGKPYVRVNCAAIPENLIESEFFGHEKGAFTGATERRDGRFELAHGGTILLDEIGEISLNVQSKLLRVLQEQEFERVGGVKTIKVDVRIIATTNRDLRQAVKEGHFREDLYYRLNVFPIEVPALRDRLDDVALLAQAFLDRLSSRNGLKFKGFSKEAMALMSQHDWPGNVRELHNTIERAVILATPGQFIQPDDLALKIVKKTAINLNQAQEEPIKWMPKRSSLSHEKQKILEALEKTAGDLNKVAEALDWPVCELKTKISRHKIKIPIF